MICVHDEYDLVDAAYLFEGFVKLFRADEEGAKAAHIMHGTEIDLMECMMVFANETAERLPKLIDEGAAWDGAVWLERLTRTDDGSLIFYLWHNTVLRGEAVDHVVRVYGNVAGWPVRN